MEIKACRWNLPTPSFGHSTGRAHNPVGFYHSPSRVINDGDYLANSTYMANSTMMAIMSRMSAYTGKSLTWQQVINSQEDLSPAGYRRDAEPPKASVAVPGVTEFV